MGFPCSLAMDDTALYIVDNFEWCRAVVFPIGPLLYDYGELCLDFSLTMVEVYDQIYKLSEFP